MHMFLTEKTLKISLPPDRWINLPKLLLRNDIFILIDKIFFIKKNNSDRSGALVMPKFC